MVSIEKIINFIKPTRLKKLRKQAKEIFDRDAVRQGYYLPVKGDDNNDL